MLKIIINFVLLCSMTISLQAKSGLTQKHLVSVSPKASSVDVVADTTIEVVFDTQIIKSSVKKDTITLNNTQGATTLVADNTLRFTPKKALPSGSYTVSIKEVQLDKKESTNTEPQPKGAFQKFIYWVCSIFYKNPADCPLCKKICTNKSENIKTEPISYTFTVEDDKPKVESIALGETSIELQEGNETTLTATATYDDNTTKDISTEAEWIVADKSVATVSSSKLKALKEGNTTIKAKYEGKTSDSLTVTVVAKVEIINGYTLPPEPDPKVNNATLLGVDSNKNGVRDDVERKIIIKYQKPIEIELMLSNAKVTQEILSSPLSEAQEIQKKFSRVGNCEMYLLDYGIEIKRSAKVSEDFTYNTKSRARKYIEYNKALSGGVYGGKISDWNAEACDFDVEQMLKDRK